MKQTWVKLSALAAQQSQPHLPEKFLLNFVAFHNDHAAFSVTSSGSQQTEVNDINGCYSGELGPRSWGSPIHPPSVFDTFCSNSRTLSVMQSRIFQLKDSTKQVIHHPWSKRFFLQ